MAVADERREGCDGCGRDVALENLTAVSMPGGEHMACCPDCEPYAREAAKKISAVDTKRAACDGCTDEFSESHLEDIVLRDGTVIACCPDCRTEVPGHSDGNTDTAVAPEKEEAETTEIANPKNLCSQCHEWVDEELFHVTTIDDRTEQMCSICKELAADKGVVKRVTMREAEAREILGIDAAADEQAVREAFLQQIKHAHPDRKTGSESAFKLVKEAYDRLA